ncbi:MAG: hypothetical protein WCI77_10595 [Candidatus Omnitrophota bacterium]
MPITLRQIKTFKIRNRRGYAAIYINHLTEGKTPLEAQARMIKALRRSGIKVVSKT